MPCIKTRCEQNHKINNDIIYYISIKNNKITLMSNIKKLNFHPLFQVKKAAVA